MHSSAVYNIAIGYLQNEKDAEELTQDVFITIHRKLSSFKGNSKLSTWIFRITVNSSLNFLKKRSRRSIFSLGKNEEKQSDFIHPGVILENREDSKIIFKAIKQLKGNQKTAFILSYVDEMPRKEVAEIMEISLKSVESLLQRAKQNLRKQLDNFYKAEGN